MATRNYPLNFTNQNAHKFDIRTRPSRYAVSELRNWRIEQGEGVRPAEYYAPYKYLPVGLQDVTTQDYIVIPKGRIVAAIGTEDTTPISGIVTPSSSGMVNLGFEPSELGGSLIRVDIDDSIFGYDQHIANLIVPANGGAYASGFYTASDVSAGTIGSDGSLVAASGSFVLPPNAPVGIVFHDWYQDIRGKYLNYKMNPDGGHVLTDGYIEIPYIKVANALDSSGCGPRPNNADYADQVLWYDVNKSFTYLEVDADSETFRAGMFVKADRLGNYQLQGALTNASGVAVDSAYDRVFTNQTVGKILSIDNRFPKDGLEDVITYPRSGLPGSETGGIPKALFDFAYTCLQIGPFGGAGTAPTIEQVYNAIREGAFGVARIQLMVS